MRSEYPRKRVRAPRYRRAPLSPASLCDQEGVIRMPCRSCMQPFSYAWDGRSTRRLYCSAECAHEAEKEKARINRREKRKLCPDYARGEKRVGSYKAPAAPKAKPRSGPRPTLGSGDWDRM